jgi:hypothetical protein
MLAVLAFRVKLVNVDAFQTVPVPVIVHSPEPIDKVRTLELVDENSPTVTLYVEALSVPLVRVNVLVAPRLSALPKVQTPPTPFRVTDAAIVTPFVVIVLPDEVELNVIVPGLFQTVLALKLIEPEIANVGLAPSANVTVPAETVMSRHVNAPVIETVYVLA